MFKYGVNTSVVFTVCRLHLLEIIFCVPDLKVQLGKGDLVFGLFVCPLVCLYSILSYLHEEQYLKFEQ